MKNKFLAILLSALLLVTMVPFAFASSADSADEGIVQGENDAVIFWSETFDSDFMSDDGVNTVFNALLGNRIQLDETTSYPSDASAKYDRIILCLTENLAFTTTDYAGTDLYTATTTKAGSFLGNELSKNSVKELIVLTSKVTVTDSDKVFSAVGTVITKDDSKAEQLYDYFQDGNGVTANMQGTRFRAICCDMVFDYIRFIYSKGQTPLFYMVYNNVTFGEHCYFGDAEATTYPILMEGLGFCTVDGSARYTEKGDLFATNAEQRVVIHGSENQKWTYISLRTRGNKADVSPGFNRGIIYLDMTNVTTVGTGMVSSFMAHDVYGAASKIYVTMEGCQFQQLAFFQGPVVSRKDKDQQKSGFLSVTMNGVNTFPNGIVGLVAGQGQAGKLTLASAKLDVTNNGTIVLGDGKTISGAYGISGFPGTKYSVFNNLGTALDAGTLIDFNTFETNENGAIVYWNTSVATANDSIGYDADHPTRGIENALRYLRGTPEGHGTIKMVGNCWAASLTGGDEIIFPMFPNNEVIIEAEEGNDFLLVPVFNIFMLRNNIIFRNINFAQTGGYKVFFAYDRNVTFENCGYYKNNGGTALTNLPVKGDPTNDSKLVLATSRRKNANNDSVSNGWVLNQTITITANDDGFALNKICAAYKSGLNLVPGAENYSYSPAPGTEYGDPSTGRTGNLNINLGENVAVKVIDAISNENNSYNVNVTLPSDLLASGKVQLKTEDAAPAAGVDTAIYVPADKVSDTSWLKTTTTFSKQGEYGYSLRAKNSAGNYAMRAGFKVPTSELSNAVEYGVLVKRSANGNPLVWFEGNGGVNATTKVGKSVVYLPDVYDNRKIETIESTEYSSFTAPLVFSNLSTDTAQNKYDFNPYVVYQSTLKDNAGADLPARVYSYGSDTGVEIKDVSLNDMISVVKTNGNDSAKALAQEIETAING